MQRYIFQLYLRWPAETWKDNYRRRRWQACQHDGSLWIPFCPPSLYSPWVTPDWTSAGEWRAGVVADLLFLFVSNPHIVIQPSVRLEYKRTRGCKIRGWMIWKINHTAIIFDRYCDMSPGFNGNLSSLVCFTEFSLVNKSKMMMISVPVIAVGGCPFVRPSIRPILTNTISQEHHEEIHSNLVQMSTWACSLVS